MSNEEQERPYIKYGHHVLTADSRQWIVGVEYENDDGSTQLQNRTYHKDPITALERLADRKMRNRAISSLGELRDGFDEMREDLVGEWESHR